MSIHDLTTQDLSSISGWISIACWVVVYSPQIWENYQLKSGEGLSVAFIVLWLIGDLTNLAGGAMAHLLPTMIILAVYYSLCDIILLVQVYWYRRQATSNPDPESTSLLAKPHPSQPKRLLPAYIEYPLLTLLVITAGITAWYIQSSSSNSGSPNDGPFPIGPHRHHHHHHHQNPGSNKSQIIDIFQSNLRGPLVPPIEKVELEWKSQLLGWSSAVLYLGSRVPQIAHNTKTRCAGLSLAMFFFSISGNVTYVASILFKSLERTYLVANASWLAGSGLTVFLDLFVLAQFAYFNWQDEKMESEMLVDDSEA